MKKTSKHLISVIVTGILMFVWIFLTVILTGGREMYEFTKQDKSIFIGFIVVEVITVSIMFFSLIRYTKTVNPKSPVVPTVPQTQYEKLLKRRGVTLLISSFLFAFVFQIIGIICSAHLSADVVSVCKTILIICILLGIACFPFQMLMSRRFVNHLNNMNVADQQQYILKHREHAEQISHEKKVFIQNCRRLAKACSIFYFILGILIAYTGGVNYNETANTIFTFMSGFLVLCAFSRIQFPVPQVAFEEDETLLDSKEYPELYKLTRKAANTLNCNGEIKIFLTNDFNAGIAQIGDIYSIQLGVILINLLSKEELYTVLLHEFAHMNSERYIRKEFTYNDFIGSGGNQHFLSNLVSSFYSYVDVMYAFHFSLYQYASSLLSESEADKLMAQHGDADYAASALLKTRYHDLYEWEEATYNKGNLFEDPYMHKNLIEKEIEETKEAYSLRSEYWYQLIQTEIISRSASHPTTKMRIDALGIKDPVITESKDVLFQFECEKAAAYMSKLIYEKNVDNYEENRISFYLEPLEKVTHWKEHGKPVIPEEYADIVNSLRGLGRVDEALQLCDKAIAELTPEASAYARYIKGCFLLHSYDAAGLEYIYDAMANNSNFIEEGLDIIGSFCCLTGNQTELDNYRQRAVEIAQKHKDLYSELSILRPKDQLVSEALPVELHESILSYITSIENHNIQNIYLVRKIIAEDFFSSVFIIQFQKNTSDKTKSVVMNKIFFFLDTCSNWQFSLYEYSEVANVKFEKIENACVYSNT